MGAAKGVWRSVFWAGAIGWIVLLTLVNTLGLQVGKAIQNIFTSAKTLSLLALIVIGVLIGRHAEALRVNFTDFWTPRGVEPIKPDLAGLSAVTVLGNGRPVFILDVQRLLVA